MVAFGGLAPPDVSVYVALRSRAFPGLVDDTPDEALSQLLLERPVQITSFPSSGVNAVIANLFARATKAAAGEASGGGRQSATSDEIRTLLTFGKAARRIGDRASCLLAFQAAAQLAPNNPWPHLDVADELRERRQFAEAEAAYCRVVAIQPGQVQALRGLGHCARARGDHEEALANFIAARDRAPNQPGPMLESADELRTLGRTQEAADIYRLLLSANPADPGASAGLAACDTLPATEATPGPPDKPIAAPVPRTLDEAEALRLSGNLAEAEQVFLAVLALDPGSVRARLGVAKCARARGERSLAMEHLTAAAAAAPEDPWPWVDLGDMHRDAAELDAAEDAYHEVLLRNRALFQPWLGLALCARQRGQRRHALALFQSADLAVPDQIAVRLPLAAELTEAGLWAAAAQTYRSVLATAPEHVGARLGLARCHMGRNDRPAALAALREIAAGGPIPPPLMLETATLFRILGALDEAEALFREVLKIQPSQADAHVGLGLIARSRGEAATARRHLRQAASLNPHHAGAALEYAFELRDSGDPAGAAAIAQEMLRRNPANPQALLSLAASERELGHDDAAYEAMQAAHAAAPGDPDTLIALARFERATGRAREADAHLDRARALGPRHPAVLSHMAERALLSNDAAAAHALFQGLMEQRPADLGLRLGLVDATIALGRVEEALAALDAAEAVWGRVPVILQKRLSLLRRDGDHHRALRQAKADATPAQAATWLERLWGELALGTGPHIDELIAAAKPVRPAERAAYERVGGALAERRWRPRDALRHYEAASALSPNDPDLLADLIRVKLLLLDIEGAWATLGRFGALMAPLARLQRRPASMSQTPFGQLIDEYRLDDVLPFLSKVLARPDPAERADLLRRLVPFFPESTALAVTLMLSMRQAGHFAAPSPSMEGAIPLRLAQLRQVAGPAPDLDRLAQTWQQACPGLDQAVYDLSAADTFLGERLPPPVRTAFRRALDPAQRADLFHLAWLSVEGGLVADPAARCLAPLGPILRPGAGLVAYQGPTGSLEMDFIAAMPGHPVIEHALDAAVTAINRGDNDTRWLSTGPGLLTRTFARLLPDGGGLPAGATMLDRTELAQVVAIQCLTVHRRRSAATAAPAPSGNAAHVR